MKVIKYYFKILDKKSQILHTKKEKAKFILRSLASFPQHYKLINFILSHEYLANTEFKHKAFITKLHRPYLYKHLSAEKKVEAFVDNYTFIDKVFPASLKTKLYTDGIAEIAAFDVQNGKKYTIDLIMYSEYAKEGELSLKIKNEDNILLATLTFSFIRDNAYEVFIGGIQGLKKEMDHTLIKEATKNLYGVFPKKILVESLYMFLDALEIKMEKVCVGNKQHPFNTLRYKTNIKISADYDSFWESLEAERLNSGLWKLPQQITRKELDEIPSKKRSLYRKRYTMLNEIEEKIYVALSRIN